MLLESCCVFLQIPSSTEQSDVVQITGPAANVAQAIEDLNERIQKYDDLAKDRVRL